MNKKFRNLLKKIQSFFFHKERIKHVVLFCFLFFVSFSLLIPAGALHDSTAVYNSAFYFSDLIKKNDDINYISVIAEQVSDDQKMNSTPDEYRSLYGTFGMRKINYAGTVNADKSEEIYIEEIDDCSNLSFLYVSVGFSNRTYEDHYMHESYPLELMFYGITSKKGSDFSFIYISQSHADYLIKKKKGKDAEILQTDYEQLISSSINLSICGISYSYTIGNIYLETNYFYDALHECMGEFLLGYNTFPGGLKKQATFFMNAYEFQNKTHLDYSLKQYDPSKYNYKIGKSQLKIDINEKKAFSFVNNQNTFKNVCSFLLLFFSIGLMVFFFYLTIKFKLSNSQLIIG